VKATGLVTLRGALRSALAPQGDGERPLRVSCRQAPSFPARGMRPRVASPATPGAGQQPPPTRRGGRRAAKRNQSVCARSPFGERGASRRAVAAISVLGSGVFWCLAPISFRSAAPVRLIALSRLGPYRRPLGRSQSSQAPGGGVVVPHEPGSEASRVRALRRTRARAPARTPRAGATGSWPPRGLERRGQ